MIILRQTGFSNRDGNVSTKTARYVYAISPDDIEYELDSPLNDSEKVQAIVRRKSGTLPNPSEKDDQISVVAFRPKKTVVKFK